MKTIYVTDRSAFLTRFGHFPWMDIQESNLNPTMNETICFIGSIIDKSELYYRKLLNIETQYITLVLNEKSKKDIDTFWINNSEIMNILEFRDKYCNKSS